MPFFPQLRYWIQTANFLRRHFRTHVKVLAPHEFLELFPGACHSDVIRTREDLDTLDAVVLHKEKFREVSPVVLQTLLQSWSPVFGNKRFVIYCRPLRHPWLALTGGWFQWLFAGKIRRHLREVPPRPEGKTVVLVTTYNRPHFLRLTLADLSRLQIPILVVDDASDPKYAEEYQAIFREFSVPAIRIPENRGLPNALTTGISYWLADPAVEWISYFQDDTEIRPDVFAVLRKFQHPQHFPLLTGRFDPLHGIVREHLEQGHRVIFQRSCPGVHLHGHRSYWEKILPIPTPYLGAPKTSGPRSGRGADEDWWITCWSPHSITKRGGAVCAVAGLVRTRSQKSTESTWGSPGQWEASLQHSPKNLSLDPLWVTGPYHGTSGYDHHVRSIVWALRQRGTPIQLQDFPQWSPTRLPTRMQDRRFEQFAKPVAAKTHLHFCMPDQVQPTRGLRNVNYTIFEGSRLPLHWVEAARTHDQIIVPTEFGRQVWINSGVPAEKVAVCPLGVDPQLFSPRARPLKLKTKDGRSARQFRYRFLNVSESCQRKNLSGLLRAWIRATTSKDDAVLIMKPGFYQAGTGEKFAAELTAIEIELGKTQEEAAPVIYVSSLLSPKEMPGIYTSATHYWSMSCGEGFDLAMLEAAACGLQLIAPAHTAYLDYLHPGIAHLLPVQAVPIPLPKEQVNSPLFAGISSWKPEESAAVELIRNLISGAIPATHNARHTLAPRFNWNETAWRLVELLSV